MKITMSPDRKYMTLEAEDESENMAFNSVKTDTKAKINQFVEHVNTYFEFSIRISSKNA